MAVGNDCDARTEPLSLQTSPDALFRPPNSANLNLRGWLAHLYVFCKGGDSGRLRRDFDLGLSPLIDSHRALFPESITPIAARRPLLRFLDQSPRYRIAVHIAQLLDPLARRPQVEIIEAPLPNVLGAEGK